MRLRNCHWFLSHKSKMKVVNASSSSPHFSIYSSKPPHSTTTCAISIHTPYSFFTPPFHIYIYMNSILIIFSFCFDFFAGFLASMNVKSSPLFSIHFSLHSQRNQSLLLWNSHKRVILKSSCSAKAASVEGN